MSVTYTIRPISDRTVFAGRHKPSPFSARWSDTEELLLREVKALRGRDLVLEVDVLDGQIRNDGRLYARAIARSSAVRVAFESMHGPLTYATDLFPTWQDNVRAIALGLEALRRVDRYGITKRGEQYAGWKALPAGQATPASHMTADEAWAILGSYQSAPISQFCARNDSAALALAYRRARAANHPDRRGGDRTLWDQVEQAARVLGVAS
jgi:hypothetical protein